MLMSGDYVLVEHKGKLVPAFVVGTPIYDEAGNLVREVCLHTPVRTIDGIVKPSITARKQLFFKEGSIISLDELLGAMTE